jgi:hypothetical protein
LPQDAAKRYPTNDVGQYFHALRIDHNRRHRHAHRLNHQAKGAGITSGNVQGFGEDREGNGRTAFSGGPRHKGTQGHG